MIKPSRLCASAVWYLRGLPCGARDFQEWKQAILWLNAVCRELEADGWQVVEESAD